MNDYAQEHLIRERLKALREEGQRNQMLHQLQEQSGHKRNWGWLKQLLIRFNPRHKGGLYE
jgi:hypothetical protein